MGEWKDIESAPKDGTRIVGLHRSPWRGESRIEVVWWQPEFDAFISGCREMTMAPGYTIDGKDRQLHSPDILKATHWLCEVPDIPPIPTQSGQE